MTGAPALPSAPRARLGVFLLLGACLVVDGFDVQAMGYAAPALLEAWGLPAAALGPVFAAGLAGLFLGSVLLGTLADRVGRRPVLVGATLVFSAFTLLAARAGSIPELAVLRFLAGLGLGAVMPNATALVGELSPPGRGVAPMMIVTNGFLVGALAGGFLSAWLVPAFGWRAVFVVGGAAPLPVALALWARLPESPAFLARRAPARLPLLALFREGRAAGTLLLWVANFANVLVAYLLASWLPTAARAAGHATAAAVLVGTAVQAGGMVGTFALGPVLQRRGFGLLAGCFVVAAAALWLVGDPGLPLLALVALAALAGFGVLAGQPGLNALAATWYPAPLRGAGLGAGLGVGRFGAILGPLAASAMLERGLGFEALFRAAALPALVTTLAVVALRGVVRRTERTAGGGPGAAPAAPAAAGPRR